MNRVLKLTLVASCAFAPPLAAIAAEEVNSQSTSPARPHGKSEAAKRALPETALLEGTVTGLDTAGGRVQIQGQWHRVVSGETQVLSGGKQVNPTSLKVGQKLKFTLAAGNTHAKTLGMVYAP
jgi:hypothetical protein